MAGNQNSKFDDLMGYDLSQLDLRHIELEIEKPPNPFWRWLAVAILLALGALVLWLPRSTIYQQYGDSSWLFFSLSLAAIALGIGVGRWLWIWFQTAPKSRPQLPENLEPPAPPSLFKRIATFGVATLGIVAILVILPDSGLLQNQSGAVSGIWFVAALGAIIIGFMLGRFLLMQAAAAEKKRPPPKPLVLPPWFKWVTLAVLVVLGLVALIGSNLMSDAHSELRFSLGGIGFLVGIFGAIWLAKRFDEAENKLRKAAKLKKVAQ